MGIVEFRLVFDSSVVGFVCFMDVCPKEFSLSRASTRRTVPLQGGLLTLATKAACALCRLASIDTSFQRGLAVVCACRLPRGTRTATTITPSGCAGKTSVR